ncbi:DUF4402 domain-containing protein [Autumnicola musiva]|uniref:DUF4402 domain-containing protein n=1 Tax=Autumnicola musiva TaxID=3075589 RepID=A0ABU3D6H1_9FLAO|nr:DUF4402 domain-containing protein [Zunongwangia sp. F117]MDT0676955.1 DUF4402 domain-containing protein [Zunongwangia sp. F117]
MKTITLAPVINVRSYMKAYFSIVFIICCMICNAQTSATANFTASVTIVEPIAISTTSNMNFASIDAKSGGEVTITPGDARLTSGGVELKDATGASAASFEVKGQKGFTYSISLPENEQILTNGSESIIIKNFVSDFTSGSLADGSHVIKVGATLDIAPNQIPGIYRSSGAMPVTVNYN